MPSDTYPNIWRIDEAPGLSVWHRSRMRRVVESICRRTGINVSFNTRDNSYLFHWEHEPFGGPLSLKAFHPDGSERFYSDNDIDDAVRFVGMCKVGRATKDRWAAQHKQKDKWERDEATEKHLDERRPGAKDYARFIDQKRRGVGKIISA